jgi:hypothetical protein
MKRLHPKLLEALDETGLPWDIEVGKKHNKLRVDGRLAVILSRGKPAEDANFRLIRNDIANIRRLAREIKGQK